MAVRKNKNFPTQRLILEVKTLIRVCLACFVIVILSACTQTIPQNSQQSAQQETKQAPIDTRLVSPMPLMPGRATPDQAGGAQAEQPYSARLLDDTQLEERLTLTLTPVSQPAEVLQTRAPFDPQAWESLPVIPELSPHAVQILQDGLARGNNPNAFSKIGDCESQTSWFLGHYDMGPDHFSLGPYEAELSPVIGFYQGSFNRLSLAAKQGFTAASLFSPLWSDRKLCQKNESPLACEYRLNRPSAAFIMIGTNDAVNPKTFEGHMRKVIEFSLEQGVLPVLGTKADNVEGDHYINLTIARLAYEYDLPLWNYWLAVQDLPGNGLQEDQAHLTYAGPFFDNPQTLKKAWPVRNLNALQILLKIKEAVQISQ